MVTQNSKIDFTRLNNITDFTLSENPPSRSSIGKKVGCAKTSVYYAQVDLGLL